MSDTKRPEADTLAQSPKDGSGQVRQNLEGGHPRPGTEAEEREAGPEGPDRPRLTPQGHASGEASSEDSTDPDGGAKEGQGNKAEGG